MFADHGNPDGWQSAVDLVNRRLRQQSYALPVLSVLSESGTPSSVLAQSAAYPRLRPLTTTNDLFAVYNGECPPSYFSVVGYPADPYAVTDITMMPHPSQFDTGEPKQPYFAVGDVLLFVDNAGYSEHATVTAVDIENYFVTVSRSTGLCAITESSATICYIVARASGATPMTAFGEFAAFSNQFQLFSAGYTRQAGESDEYLRSCMLPLLIDDVLLRLENNILLGPADTAGRICGLVTQQELFRPNSENVKPGINVFGGASAMVDGVHRVFPQMDVVLAPQTVFEAARDGVGSSRNQNWPDVTTITGGRLRFASLLRWAAPGNDLFAALNVAMLLDSSRVKIKPRKDGSWSYRISATKIEVQGAYTLEGVDHASLVGFVHS